jgi:transposase
MKARKHSVEFKRQVVEEIISGVSGFGQICRRYNLAPSIVSGWKKKYKEGHLIEGPQTNDTAQMARIADLERMVGRLTMENDLLKKAAVYMEEQRRKALLPITAKTLEESKRGVKP